MITLAWYNIVAIVVGIAFIIWFIKDYDEGNSGYIPLGGCLPFICGVLFYIIWGGIFWW